MAPPGDLFAHDYGGFLALGFTQRHPARVRRLAILNSRAHRTFVPAWYAAFTAVSLLGRTPLGGLVPFAAINRLGLRGAVRKGVVDKETLESYLGWMSTRDGARWLAHYFGDYRVPARRDLAAGLGAIRCPTAIIWGAADPYLRTSIAEELAAGIPGAELTLLDGVGHFVMEEAPDAVMAALEKLLASP